MSDWGVHLLDYALGTVGNNRQSRFAVLVSPDFYGTDTTDISRFQIIGGLVPMRIAALPLAYLYDPVIFAGSLFHQVAFFDGVWIMRSKAWEPICPAAYSPEVASSPIPMMQWRRPIH